MGRNTADNDTLNRIPVFISGKSGARSYGVSNDTRSATASLTAIALTGPGVVSLLGFTTAADQKIISKVYVDGTLASSVSSAMTLMTAAPLYAYSIIGGFEFASTTSVTPMSLEEIPFKSSFLCMYEIPTHSAPSTNIYYTYRLTE